MIFRFLLFLLFFYLIYMLVRNVFIRPFRQGFQGGGRSASQDYQRRKEGDVTVEYQRKGSSSKPTQVGEYVDYEEIDEDQKD